MNIETNYQPSHAYQLLCSIIYTTVDQAVAVITENILGYSDLFGVWKSQFMRTLDSILDEPQTEIPFDLNINKLVKIREDAGMETTWHSVPRITQLQADCYAALGLEVPGTITPGTNV